MQMINPRLQRAGEPNADDPGHSQMKRMTGQGHGNVQSSCPDSEHGATRVCRRVAVRSEKSLTGHAEALQVNLMGYAVPRF